MFYTTLINRRSTRKFTEQKIEKEKIEKLVKAALLSPSSKNNRPWEFIVIDDTQVLQSLSKAKPHGSQFLDNAALAIVVMADTSKSDVWIEDASIASMSLLLMAEELGLGACWVQIRERFHSDNLSSCKYLRELLNIPDLYEVESIIGFGYPQNRKPPYNEDSLLYHKLHHNLYGKKLYI